MKKFRGWRQVFAFTFRQGTGTKGYRIVTTLLALVIFGIAMLISILSAKPEKQGTQSEGSFNGVSKVYVVNQTSLTDIPFAKWVEELTDDAYEYLEWENVENATMTEQELAEMVVEHESNAAIGILIYQNEAINVRAVVPSTSDVSLGEGQEIAELAAQCVEKKRVETSGLSEFQMQQMLKPVVLNVIEAGAEVGMVAYLIQYIAPLLFGLVLYFMLLLYGQTICQEVSTEKTSKLMETLLTSLHPYGLLAGKVFAIAGTAMLQFFIWVAAGVAGLIGGVEIGRRMYPETESSIAAMIAFLRDNIGETALSPAAVVLAIVIFCCGFLFYSVLSGMAGSMVTRPEEASSVASVFTFPVLISWLVTYMGTLTENASLLAVARNIPFTIPFCVPVELLTGTTGILQGLISAAILLAFSAVIIMISARIYRGLVLYTGQKLSMKAIIGVIRNK